MPESGPPHAIGYLVWRVALKSQASTSRALAPLGLTHTQYSVLASLYGLSQSGDRPSQRELADWSGLEQMHVSKVVRALEKAGLVERATSAADPRARALALTAAGRRTVTAAIRIVRDLEHERVAPMGERKAAQLSRLLRELLAAMDDGPRDGHATVAGPLQ